MRRELVRTAVVLAAFGATAGCAVVRPVLFWRDARLVGKVKMGDEAGAPVAAKGAGVTVNFINLGSKIEDSVVSVQTDPGGRYRSPELAPGKYKVEAMYPGYVIESTNLQLKSHEHKGTDIVLKKIREARGRSVKESHEDNIPTPGEVKITPPPY
jgi:carboxypeptidase family protein